MKTLFTLIIMIFAAQSFANCEVKIELHSPSMPEISQDMAELIAGKILETKGYRITRDESPEHTLHFYFIENLSMSGAKKIFGVEAVIKNTSSEKELAAVEVETPIYSAMFNSLAKVARKLTSKSTYLLLNKIPEC